MGVLQNPVYANPNPARMHLCCNQWGQYPRGGVSEGPKGCGAGGALGTTQLGSICEQSKVMCASL